MKKFFKNKYIKYEKYLSPIALIVGFVIDNLTLRRIDLWAENIIIVFYLLIALTSIFVLNISHAGILKHKYFRKTEFVFLLLLQLVFGALFSVFFVFYFRSAHVISGWVFLVLLMGLLIGNESFREKYKRLTFQLSIFFISLFSYSVILVPLLTRKINNYTFLFSGIFSLAIMVIILFFLNKFFPKRFSLSKKYILLNIMAIYFFFNLLYFTNLIPPIPLSLKSSELVHDLERVGNSYEVSYEKSSYFQMGHSKNVFSWREGDPVYLYNSIFAPTKINITIFNNWYFYDEQINEWVLKNTLSYKLLGGRDGGYRGYSYKKSVQAGKWKIEISNKKGQILGSKKFKIIKVLDLPPLEKDTW